MVRVLIIDASAYFRERAHSILKCDGLAIIEARDGLAGLQRAIEDRPDLIVVDLALAGLDGIDICRRIRNEEHTRRIPIVIWSSSSDPRDRIRATRAGAYAFVVRSNSSTELAERVHESLGSLGPRQPELDFPDRRALASAASHR